MKRLQIQRVGTLRGLFETFVLGAILLIALLAVSEQLPNNAISLGTMYIGAGCALWYTLRLRLPAGVLWRKAIFEGLNTAALGLTVGLLLPFLVKLSGLWDAVQGAPSREFLFLPLAICVPAFVGLRALLYGWFWWDRLRQRKLIWGLVHTQLSVVVVVTVLLSLAGSVLVLLDAMRNFPEETLTATVAHRLVLTILPFMAVATVGLVFTLMGILPPAALVSYLFSRRITRRLEALTVATADLRQGDYAARVEVSGTDEVAQLQKDFNAMAADLETALDSVQTERDRVTTLLETRRQLTASVSHELRTPLATLRGYLEPAIENNSPPSPEDLIIIAREVQHLERQIDDLFTLSQAQVGQLTLQTQPTDLQPITQRLVDTYAPLAWQRGRVDVVAQFETDLPSALVDAGRVEQIITNLLGNGVRHTPPGGIVAVAISSAGDGVLIKVRDTGEGIDPDELSLIWERYYRGSKGGAGLGLALVKELTESMGGAVSVASVLGEGSVFTIKLPKA